MDWLTGAMTLLAMELISRKRWEGWAIGLANQAFWLALIYQRSLYGLLPLTMLLTWRYAVAIKRWRDDDDRT